MIRLRLTMRHSDAQGRRFVAAMLRATTDANNTHMHCDTECTHHKTSMQTRVGANLERKALASFTQLRFARRGQAGKPGSTIFTGRLLESTLRKLFLHAYLSSKHTLFNNFRK